jgi:hypothetical protein
MLVVKPGDQVRVTSVVYRNPQARIGIMAQPGQTATVLEWVNAGAMRVELDDGTTALISTKECEPL